MSGERFVFGNWKMNLAPDEASSLLAELRPACEGLSRTHVGVAPAAISIPAALEATAGSDIKIGAQNVHWEGSGAFTGELSIPMLRNIGCSFALAGHSERRHVFGETDDLIAKRVLASLVQEFPVIFCIGEKLDERESGSTTQVLENQLAAVLDDLKAEQADHLIIAYEPVWAIGTGKVAGPAEIEQAHADIVRYWESKIDCPCPPILYGGSVSPDNFSEIIKIEHVSGALVGGASLSAEKLSKLIAIAEES